MAGGKVEQGRSSPDIAYLLERGGLTLTHWEEVVNELITYPHRHTPVNVRGKILAYANKVISGEFPDTGNYHREFLGRRHWWEIMGSGLRRIEWIERRLIFFRKTMFSFAYKSTELTQQLHQYVGHEITNNYTFNDYIEEEVPSLRYIAHHDLRYEEGVWFRYFHTGTSEYRPGADPEIEMPIYITGPDVKHFASPEDILDWYRLLGMVRLPEGIVADPVHASPEELRRARLEYAITHHEELKALVIKQKIGISRDILNSPHFFIIEKEVE